MRITIKITQPDFLEFNVYNVTQMPTYYRSLVMMALIVPLMIGLLAFFIIDQMAGYTWVWILLAGVVSLYWIVTTPTRFKRQVRKQVVKMTSGFNEFIGEFCLELTDHKLEYTGKNLHVEYAYGDVKKVVWNKGCYYILLANEAALLVPETGFAGQLEEQTFMDMLREKAPQALFKIV